MEDQLLQGGVVQQQLTPLVISTVEYVEGLLAINLELQMPLILIIKQNLTALTLLMELNVNMQVSCAH